MSTGSSRPMRSPSTIRSASCAPGRASSGPRGRARAPRISSGGTSTQRWNACGQRSRKWQPSGGRRSEGGWPLICGRRSLRGAVEARSASRAGPRCRGGAGRRRPGRALPCSTIRPAYITATRSAISATTPRSWVIRIIAIPSSSRSRASSSRIWAWVVTSSAVVGSSAISSFGSLRERHRDHRPLAHAARELVRVVVDPASGVGNADQLEQLDRAPARRLLPEPRGGRRSPRRSGRRPGRRG